MSFEEMSKIYDQKIFKILSEFQAKFDRIENLLEKISCETNENKNLSDYTSKFITLNSRGRKFQVSFEKLSQFPTSTRIGKLNHFYKSKQKVDLLRDVCDSYDLKLREFYFDRDPNVLNSILNFYETGRLHFHQNFCSIYLSEELKYWKIDDNHINMCCKFKLKEMQSETDVFYREETFDKHKYEKEYKKILFGPARLKLLNIIENPKTSWGARVRTNNLI